MFETKAQRDKFYSSYQWKQLRESILKRDNYECQWCKREGKVTTRERSKLIVDHIKELKDYPALATDPDNLRTLCWYHHEKRHDRLQDFKDYRPEPKWDDEWW